jgi:putative ribosome biogenesis GTPase RsgA
VGFFLYANIANVVTSRYLVIVSAGFIHVLVRINRNDVCTKPQYLSLKKTMPVRLDCTTAPLLQSKNNSDGGDSGSKEC